MNSVHVLSTRHGMRKNERQRESNHPGLFFGHNDAQFYRSGSIDLRPFIEWSTIVQRGEWQNRTAEAKQHPRKDDRHEQTDTATISQNSFLHHPHRYPRCIKQHLTNPRYSAEFRFNCIQRWCIRQREKEVVHRRSSRPSQSQHLILSKLISFLLI